MTANGLTLDIYTDGGCRSATPGARTVDDASTLLYGSVGGWGFIAIPSNHKDGGKIYKAWGTFDAVEGECVTSMQAETRAIAEALKFIKLHLIDADFETIVVHSDAKMLVSNCQCWVGKWAKSNWCNGRGSLIKNLDEYLMIWKAGKAIDQHAFLDGKVPLTAHHKLHFQWVESHSGNHGNDQAHDLVGLAFKEYDKKGSK